MESGIYQLVNNISGENYVGSTKNLKSRMSGHFSVLRNGKHQNHKIQKSFDDHGKDAFSFEILELTNPENLKKIEQKYIDTGDYDLNISRDAFAPLTGRKGTDHPKFRREVSAETRQKLSTIAKNRIVSEETRRKQSERQKGQQVGNGNRYHAGEFVTPWGTFMSSSLAATASNGLMLQAQIFKLCKNPDVEITNLNFRKSKFLKSIPDKSALGKTYRDLGFSFIPKR